MRHLEPRLVELGLNLAFDDVSDVLKTEDDFIEDDPVRRAIAPPAAQPHRKQADPDERR